MFHGEGRAADGRRAVTPAGVVCCFYEGDSVMKSLVVCALGAAMVLSMACLTAADPLPGRDVLKFSQKPMIATPIPTIPPTGGPVETVIYYGHDELSTAWRYPNQEQPVFNGIFMADDFADNFNREVVHVRWWGSYMNRDIVGGRGVDQFLIAFEKDVPANDPDNNYGFSHPACGVAALNSQISRRDMDGALMPMEGTFTETLVPGSNPLEPVYEYNAELLCPFPQMADTVYWLKIVALVDEMPDTNEPLRWGWHNRDYTIFDPLASKKVMPGEYVEGWLDAGTPNEPEDDIAIWHFQDDAVSGSIENIYYKDEDPCYVHMDQDQWRQSMVPEKYVDLLDGPNGISRYSKDLAFQLFTVPEPGSLALLALGTLLLAIRRFIK